MLFIKPLIVKDFHYDGNEDLILTIPFYVMSQPPKPKIILWRTPPAPVIKYGFVPCLVYANTLNGGSRLSIKDYLK